MIHAGALFASDPGPSLNIPNHPMPQSQPSAQSFSFKQPRFRWTTDPTFYPTARLAMEAPRERLAYVAGLAPDNKSRSDALFVVDVDPASPSYGSVVSRLDLPNIGDELHHFGWNACSAALCPYAPHPHLERRYLVVPGLRSSRIHIIDTRPIRKSLRSSRPLSRKKFLPVPATPVRTQCIVVQRAST